MPDDDEDEFEARIVALETQTAYQVDAVEKLNAVVTEQWSVIEKLTRELSEIRERLTQAEARQPIQAVDEIPPHY